MAREGQGMPLPSGEQETAVLARLRKGPLTGKQAMRELGVYRLAAVVLRLRERGWPVATEMLREECRSGRVARFARYHLDSAPRAQGAA